MVCLRSRKLNPRTRSRETRPGLERRAWKRPFLPQDNSIFGAKEQPRRGVGAAYFAAFNEGSCLSLLEEEPTLGPPGSGWCRASAPASGSTYGAVGVRPLIESLDSSALPETSQTAIPTAHTGSLMTDLNRFEPAGSRI